MIYIKKTLIVTAEAAFVGITDDFMKMGTIINLQPLRGESEKFLEEIKNNMGLAIILPIKYPIKLWVDNIKLWADVESPAEQPIIHKND